MVSPIFSGRFSIKSPFQPGRVCGVIAASTSAQAVRQIRTAIGPGTALHTLEVRLDFLCNSKEQGALLAWLDRKRRTAFKAQMPTVIATCRRRAGGGKFAGDVEAEMKILAQAARSGCGWCDVEIESAEHIRPEDLRRRLSPARLLISAHDFRGIPRKLPALVGRLARRGGHAVKIAAVCRSLADVRRLIQLVRAHRDAVVIPMGENMAAARVLALREGSALTYAAVAGETAAGQLSVDAAIHVYRLNRRFGKATDGPTRHTRLYGVIGNPIVHSLSPVMHNAAFAARRADAIYLPFDVPDLGDFIRSILPLGISGFSVTLPHKQAMLGYLDHCDPLAAAIGAVNTVVVRGTRLYGYNTDYAGVLRAIESRMSLRSSRVLLVGAGGAARAAAFALANRGSAVAIYSRRPEQARALAREAGVEAIERRALRNETFDAIVNCTPVGLHRSGGSPLEPAELRCRLVMDMVYRPRLTPLLRMAASLRIGTISGVEMFLAQGAAQYELWAGQRAPRAVMRKAVLAALDQEEREAKALSRSRANK